MRAAFIIFGMALLATACASSGTIEGRRITATATLPQKPTVPDLYEGAPSYAQDAWRHYIKTSAGSYAVLAVDRNARGYGFIYCVGGGCHNNSLPQARSFVEVNYKNGALKNCRRHVQDNYPAEKPDCAIFAIKDKIVWEGPMPWE